jgi:hypothetical protein
MNTRKTFEWHAGGDETFWAGERDRTRSFRPVWVRQNIQSVELKEQGGMPDPRNSRLDVVLSQPRPIIVDGDEWTGSWMQRRGPQSGCNEFHSVPFGRISKEWIDVPETGFQPVTIRPPRMVHVLF